MLAHHAILWAMQSPTALKEKLPRRILSLLGGVRLGPLNLHTDCTFVVLLFLFIRFFIVFIFAFSLPKLHWFMFGMHDPIATPTGTHMQLSSHRVNGFTARKQIHSLIALEASSPLVLGHDPQLALPLPLWDPYLRSHPDQRLAAYLRWGIQFGFRVGLDATQPLESCITNHPSVLSNPDAVGTYLQDEVSSHRLIQAPTADWDLVHASPIGIIPKSNHPGKYRLIHNLSYPKGRCMNDGILLGSTWHLSSSPQSPTAWHGLSCKGVDHLIHYLDDFLFVGPPGLPICTTSLDKAVAVCNKLGLPVAPFQGHWPIYIFGDQTGYY